MDVIVLARCWAFDDGTSCVLSKLGPQTWELRVLRGKQHLRVEVFGDLGVALSTASQWRAEFGPAQEIA